MALYPFDDEEEAIARANDTVFGLNASVLTGNHRHGARIAHRLRAGTVNVKGIRRGLGQHACPHGWDGGLRLGRRHGDEGLLKYTEAQSVAVQRLLGFGPQFGLDDEKWGDALTLAIKAMKTARLSQETHMESFDYDVVIIGSGFGGSVSALRLTEKGYRVAVLEAGRRFDEKTFPKT